MPKAHKLYWTPKRLRTLLALFPVSSEMQLMRKFKKPWPSIVAAHHYAQRLPTMRVSRTKTRTQIITVFKTGYAEGTTRNTTGL